MKLTTLLLVLMLTLAGCKSSRTSNSDEVQRQKTEKQMQQMEATVGMPSISNYFEKKMAKMIFELRDQANLVRYAYIITLSGNKVFLGKCLGYGLPYSVQYTNPMKIASQGREYGYAILPQADPNGLFMPSGLSATWLLLIDPKTGDPVPTYVENEIVVSGFPLH